MLISKTNLLYIKHISYSKNDQVVNLSFKKVYTVMYVRHTKQ